MKLSVIVVNYNVEYFLEQCLLSVQQAINDTQTEVWVVDNNSVDGSVAMVKLRFPWVKLIESKENLGFSRGNNLAIRQAEGEYILLLNPDTVVEEDTFEKVIAFMDAHQEAGGLGVKMIDGKGAFLPESKRGLPTPAVAFFKIFGLSALFPRSRKFGRYHLGYLRDDEVHEVEILSGAFMLMRKSALDKVGLLDEDFFMYGEDIDLSWRLIQGGYKNYYYPHTRIIHYKGESTKKSSINYVFVFYRAMVIFAHKHFSEKNVKLFSLLINAAIYFRAGLAIVNRFIQRAVIPAIDAATIWLFMLAIKDGYQNITEVNLEESIVHIALPVYTAVLVFAVFLSSGYEKPLKWSNIAKGVVFGSIVILIGYSLLPESMRFSRALTLTTSLASLLVLFTLRGIYYLLKWPSKMFGSNKLQRVAIVGLAEECERVSNLLRQTSREIDFIGWVYSGKQERPSEFLGDATQLQEITEVHKTDGVIFCAKDVSAQDIIAQMSALTRSDIEFKIAPPESMYIIGSKSIEGAGELFVFDINSISKNANRRNKRLFDWSTSLVLLLLAPLLVWFVQKKVGFIFNLFDVIIGKRTWVGFYPNSIQNLPRIKPGVLQPGDLLPFNEQKSETMLKLNVVYAKDYRIRTDLEILLKNLRQLGRKI